MFGRKPDTQGFNPEQGFQMESQPLPDSRSDRLAGLRRRAVDAGREVLAVSVDSGTAEKFGHTAIDAAALTATTGLELLPPGTRFVGKRLGKMLIGHMQEQAHGRLPGALDSVVARAEAQPALPTSGPFDLPPTQEWTSAYQPFGEPTAPAAPANWPPLEAAPAPSWSGPQGSRAAEAPLSPDTGLSPDFGYKDNFG